MEGGFAISSTEKYSGIKMMMMMMMMMMMKLLENNRLN